MAYRITTPILKSTADRLNLLMGSMASGEMEASVGHTIIRAANGLRGLVETDLKARLAAPKLREIEEADKASK